MSFAGEGSGMVYKLLDRADWENACRTGSYGGSADDLRDGFVHLSASHQLAGTLARHFAGRADLVLVAYRAADLGERLVWEPSRGGDLFPHLYAPLPTASALSVTPLALGPDGIPELPEGAAR